MVRDKVFLGSTIPKIAQRHPPLADRTRASRAMEARFAEVRAGRSAIADALSAARSARNRATRDATAQATEDRARVHRHRSKRAAEDRDLKRASRIRIQMPEQERPRLGGRTPRKLFHRLGGQVMRAVTSSGGTGPAMRSIHFAFVARGFASRTGRRWRTGEGERAALYIVREEGLEGGEAGWWSNIAEDRNELAAFHRASEALEKHDRKNANVYVTEIITLSAALTARQRRKAIRRYCRYFDERGLPYTAAMHLPDPNGDDRNYHCHIIYSLRPTQRMAPYDWSFAVSKLTDVNTPGGIRQRRRLAVEAINATLIASGSEQRYTHLTNRARGMGAAQPKQGQSATWTARRIAGAEARADQLARLQDLATRMRAGINLILKVDAARDAVAARLRAARTRHGKMVAIDLRRLARLRMTVIERLEHLQTATVSSNVDQRFAAVRMIVRARLSAATTRIDLDDTLRQRLDTAERMSADRVRRQQALEATRVALTDRIRAAPDLSVSREATRAVLKKYAARLDQDRLKFKDRLDAIAAHLGRDGTGQPRPEPDTDVPHPNMSADDDPSTTPLVKLTAKDARAILRQTMAASPRSGKIERPPAAKGTGQTEGDADWHAAIEQRHLILRQEKERRKRIGAERAAAERAAVETFKQAPREDASELDVPLVEPAQTSSAGSSGLGGVRRQAADARHADRTYVDPIGAVIKDGRKQGSDCHDDPLTPGPPRREGNAR